MGVKGVMEKILEFFIGSRTKVREYQLDIKSKDDFIDTLERSNYRLKMENILLRKENDRINKNRIIEYPDFILETKKHYIPSVQVNTRSGVKTLKVSDPRVLFSPENPMIQSYAKSMKWKEMNHDAKLISIWHFVIDHIQYRFDKGEDWRPSWKSSLLGFGDCEDSSIDFVDLCIASGVDASDVFLVTGYWDLDGDGKDSIGEGHAWPIAQMEDGNWYVFESTLEGIHPDKPRLFFGSPYRSRGDLKGIFNPYFRGVIKYGKEQI